ncbi:MAG: NAD-binding protein, partial [Limisphaerales bacterium]
MFQLNAERVQVVYGDATNPEILRSAKIEQTAGLGISNSTPEAATIIASARELNTKIVLTHCTYLAQTNALRTA